MGESFRRIIVPFVFGENSFFRLRRDHMLVCTIGVVIWSSAVEVMYRRPGTIITPADPPDGGSPTNDEGSQTLLHGSGEMV